MRLLIAYNAASGDVSADAISENAVRDEAEAVYRAAMSLNYEVELLAVRTLTDAIAQTAEYHPDVVFNLCEGLDGNAHHEMHMASLWELLGIPFTGNRPLTLGLAQDKVLTKRLLQSRNIHTPVFQVAEQIPDRALLEFPVIVKPACEDASLGIHRNSVVNDLDQLKQVTGELLKQYNQPALIEKYIPGREFNISIMGDPPQVLAVSEIDFSGLGMNEPHITGYEAKWIESDPLFQKTPSVCPAKILTDLRKRLEDVSLQVFKLLGGRDYGRVDTRVDQEGRIWVLEYNPNPDISPDAGFSKAVRAAGMTYDRFVQHLILLASRRGANDAS